ncbi:Elongation factor 3 [Durusdinium trenchii]
MLTWSVGILQMALFNIIVLSRKYTFFIGPLMLSTGSLIAGYFYVQVMKTNGADALLDYAGVKDSTWLNKAQSWANDWGVLGLVGMQVIPIPIPSAVIVIAGMMAKMNEIKILVTVYLSKFIQLTLGAVALKYATENQTPEQFIRQQMGAKDE